jgi:hypothetical protein
MGVLVGGRTRSLWDKHAPRPRRLGQPPWRGKKRRGEKQSPDRVARRMPGLYGQLPLAVGR